MKSTIEGSADGPTPRFFPRVLTAEERAKLHHEVTQIVNHRFLLATLAVTVFAISAGWIVPQFNDIKVLADANRVSALSLVLTFIMLVLYWHSHYLRTVLRTFTSYLIVVDQSRWEKDWHAFRQYHDRDAHNDTKAQILAYVGFCMIAGFFPAVATLSLFGTMAALQWIALVVGATAGTAIILHTHRYEEHCEERFMMEWENALRRADMDVVQKQHQADELARRCQGADNSPLQTPPPEPPPT